VEKRNEPQKKKKKQKQKKESECGRAPKDIVLFVADIFRVHRSEQYRRRKTSADLEG